MKICIGIISYLPNNESHNIRRDVFAKEIKSLNIALNLPILVIAQNYTEEDKKIFTDNCIVDYYGPLGVTKARQTLRHKFLETDFDYVILFDDDEIIENTSLATKYLETIYNNPDKYIHYYVLYLRACAISRYVMERVPFVAVNAPKLEGWDDAMYVDCVHKMCPESYMLFPEDNDLICNIDKSNTAYPSTWFQKISKASLQILERNSIVKRQRIAHDPDFIIPEDWYDWKEGITLPTNIQSVISNCCLGQHYYQQVNSQYLSPFIGSVIDGESIINFLENLDTIDLQNISQEGKLLTVDNKVKAEFIHLQDNEITERYLRRAQRFDKNNVLVILKVEAEEGLVDNSILKKVTPKEADKIIEICVKNNYRLIIFDAADENYREKCKDYSNIQAIKISKAIKVIDILPTYKKEIQL